MSVAGRLLAWYRRDGRDLPWRRAADPYRVWVSEILLQQTTVATAIPYFERFVARYPTVRALAAARQEDLLALWSGLGYYHRARNMLKAARLMVRRHGATVPADLESLTSLPGVGPYTAGAVLSIGHNLPYPALDGNVIRVVSRLGAIPGDPARAATRRAIEIHVRRLMPEGEASAFNQALMDLGASLCAPRRPGCVACPVRASCRALREGRVDRIPPPRSLPASRRVDLAALAVRRGESFLLVRRDDGPLMRGMWEFPLVEASTRAEAEREARRIGARVTLEAGRLRHTITRHRMVISVYEARPARAPGSGPSRAVSEPKGRWMTLGEMAERSRAGRIPLTGAARKIARLLASPARAGRAGSGRS